MRRLRWVAVAALIAGAAWAAVSLRGEAPRGASDVPARVETRTTRADAAEEGPVLPEGAVTEADLGPAAALYRRAVEAYQAGDLEGAVAGLREAAALVPGQPVVETSLTIALEALGHRRLADGDFASAEAALAEALARDGGRAESWKALGYAQLRQRRPADARASLEEAVRLGPDDAQANLLLGYARYETGDAAGALTALRAGRPAAAGDPGYDALVARLTREVEAEAGFRTAGSAHFTVSFEGGGTSEQAGYLVSLLLEEAYHAVGRRLEVYPDEPVHAVLYPRERFRDVTRSPDWAGAIYDGKIRLPIGGLTDRTEALRRVIAHEYTHALVHRLSRGRAPVWLNEGLAQLGEDADIEAARDRFLAHVRAGGPVVSLRRLEGSFMGLDAAEAELAYLEALTATDFLVTRYGPAASRRILDRLGAGAPIAAAIEEVLYVSYEEFERQWVARYR